MKKTIVTVFICLFALYSSGQTRRYVNQAAIGLDDGTSWENAYSNLQTAISACAVGDTLWIASGTYIPSTLDRDVSFEVDGITLYGGFAGDEISADQRNPIENPTVLSGDINGDDNGFVNNSENSLNIIKVAPDGNACTIDGFYIEGGYAEGAYGGGIYFTTGLSTLLSIRNCVFRYNKANNGGAIYLLNTMLSTSFLHTVNIENCVFENNSSSMNGSAIFKYRNIKLSLTNCTFVSNPNIVLYNSSSDYVFRVTNSIFLDHSGTDYIASYDGTYAFDHCLFDNNPSGFTGSFTNNYTNTDPLLKDDFQLSPASPARDAGINDPVSTTLDLAGLDRIMNETVDIGAYEFNTTPPEVTISTGFSETYDTLIEATVVFNETISGLESDDFAINNASLSSLTEVNPGLVYTLAISHNLTGTVTIELPAASTQNENEIANNYCSISYTYTDTIIPKVTLLLEYAETNNSDQILTIIFSDEVTGLELSDLLVTNGSVSDLQTIQEGRMYTVNTRAVLSGQVNINLCASAVVDLNNLPNNQTSISYTYTDITPPVVTIDPAVTVTNEQSLTVSVSFSEEITGLEIDDFSVTNGSASNLQTLAEGFEYSIDITAVTEGEVVITLPAGAVNDLNTLPNDVSTTGYTYSVINGLYSSNFTDITIYPNPATDYVIVDTKGFLYYEIYTETGMKIAEGNNEYIDVSVIKKGIYFLQVHTDDKIISDIKLLLIR